MCLCEKLLLLWYQIFLSSICWKEQRSHPIILERNSKIQPYVFNFHPHAFRLEINRSFLMVFFKLSTILLCFKCYKNFLQRLQTVYHWKSLKSSFQHTAWCYTHHNMMLRYHREPSLRHKVKSDNTNVNCIKPGLRHCNHCSHFQTLTWRQLIKHHKPRKEKECWSHSEEHVAEELVATGFATCSYWPATALPKLQNKWKVIRAPVFPS